MTPHADIDLVLVDFDDTLVDTAPRFARARQALFARLEAAGFDRETVERVHHHEVDPVMRRDHGFGPHRMPVAFGETYRALCRSAGREPDPDVAAACERLGAEVAGTPPPLAGALEALRRLAGFLPTAVYTQAGDAAYQMGCLRDAGALDAVGEDRVRIVPVKTVEALRGTLRSFGIDDPGRTWMIGNSLRSDINPALEAGARAILVEITEPWHHDVVDPLHRDFPTVPSFPAAVDFLLGNGVR
jgi:putative hydrolase of the HAD superfamily